MKAWKRHRYKARVSVKSLRDVVDRFHLRGKKKPPISCSSLTTGLKHGKNVNRHAKRPPSVTQNVPPFLFNLSIKFTVYFSTFFPLFFANVSIR